MTMTLWQAILLGIVQGLTEFIPISSTAHLTLAGKLMGIVNPERPEEWTAFIAVIQLGTLIAVILYFLKDIFEITRGWLKTNLSYVTKAEISEDDRHWSMLGWMVIVGSIPVGVVGLLFRHQIEGKLTKNLWIIGTSEVGLALILTLAEIIGRRRRDMKQLTILDSIVVGVAQCFALIPGSSRSGTTIAGGLFSGLNREAAARFSFLLSIPAVAASGLLELKEALHSISASPVDLAISTLFSLIFGYLSIAWLLKYLQRHSTYLFVGYRVGLGVVILALLAYGKVSAY
ncbi:MAG: undecaprenyl-diphosphate phosphatase [Blastocatellia bacterium]